MGGLRVLIRQPGKEQAHIKQRIQTRFDSTQGEKNKVVLFEI